MSSAFKIISLSFVAIIATIALGIIWIYERIEGPSNELHNQLRAMIVGHDVTKMKSLSIDGATDKFLLSLPKDVSINVSDFQGGGETRPGVVIGYFPAELGKQRLECYMLLHKNPLALIPDWQLIKVSVKPVGIDPSWAD